MKQKVGLMFLVVVMMLGFAVSEGLCLELLNGDLFIKGYLRNDTGIRLENGDSKRNLHPYMDSGDVYMFRNTIRLDFAYRLLDNVSFYGTYRGVYDAAMDLDHGLENNMRRAGVSKDNINDSQYENEMREAYMDAEVGNWFFRVGKQQWVWGEADGLRMADIVNPLDFSWHFIFAPWEDIRIPMYGITTAYRFPCSTHGETLELIFLPGCFDNGWQPAKFANAGSNWSLPGYPQLFMRDIRDSIPDKSLRNCSAGFRLKGVYGGWDVAFFNLYSRIDQAIFQENYASRMAQGRKDIFQYPYTYKIGGTFNVNCNTLGTVFRGECVFTIDQPYGPFDAFDPNVFDKNGHIPIYERNTFAYMLGFDRPTMINWLNYGRSFFFTGQIFQKYIFNYSTKQSSDLGGHDKMQTLLTLNINTGYMNDNLLPQIFIVKNLSGECWYMAEVKYKWRTVWEIGLGANVITANKPIEPSFGGFSDCDEIYTWIKWQF